MHRLARPIYYQSHEHMKCSCGALPKDAFLPVNIPSCVSTLFPLIYLKSVHTLGYNECCILVWGRIMGGSKEEVCADICNVAQVTDIRTLPNWCQLMLISSVSGWN